jgi:hypothetical protein
MNVHTTDPIVSPQLPLPSAVPQTEKNGAPATPPEEGSECEEIEYNPIPPCRIITVLVRYELQGRGQPLPYELEEEVSE